MNYAVTLSKMQKLAIKRIFEKFVINCRIPVVVEALLRVLLSSLDILLCLGREA